MLDIMYISHDISYIFHMSGWMYSNVELNFGMGLFSSIFQSWFGHKSSKSAVSAINIAC